MFDSYFGLAIACPDYDFAGYRSRVKTEARAGTNWLSFFARLKNVIPGYSQRKNVR